MKKLVKLAALLLTAALTLTLLAGCGAGGTGSAFNTKEEVLNYICGYYYTYTIEKTANRDTKLDTLAADLITAANQAEGEEVEEKLWRAAQDEKFDDYVYCYDICTDLTTSVMKEQYLNNLCWNIISGTNYADEINIGAATGKIGDKTYIVVMAKVVKLSSH